MSNPSPSPPPLPPPTVPSQNPIPHLPPPQPKEATTPSSLSLRALLEISSDPAPASPASSHTSSNPSPMSDKNQPHREFDDDRLSKKRRLRTCFCHCRPRFTPHHIHEPATSLWFDTRVLLLFRLAVTATLLGHLVFFSLRGDFSYRVYSTWNLVGLSLAFVLIVICSLLDVLRDEDSANHDDIAPTQGEGMITDVERQPLGRPPLPDPKLARAFTCVTVPLYQVFITATLFGTIIYWAALHHTSTTSISYPLIILKIFAPAAALLDFLLSLRMRFRLLYVLLYTLYNGAYVAALVLFDKLLDDPVYPLFDPSVQSTKQFITKSAGIGAASLVMALLVYAFSYIPLISCFTGKEGRVEKKLHSVDGSDSSPTTASDTSDSSPAKPVDITNRGRKSTDSADFGSKSQKNDVRSWSVRSATKRDRLSLPLSGSGTLSPSTSAQRFRPSSVRMVTSRSGSSIGSEERSTNTWENLDHPSARIEDEYFAMPAVSAEREVIKLQPMPRNQSTSSLPGLLPRSSSGRMSRSGSLRMPRSGSRTVLMRSQSDRSAPSKSFARVGSTGSLR